MKLHSPVTVPPQVSPRPRLMARTSVRIELENGHKAQSVCCQELRLKLLMYGVGE